MRSTFEMIKRYCFLFGGLFVNAIGVVLLAKSGLGTSPMGAMPLVLSEKFSISLGVFTFGLYGVFFLVQMVLLGKNLKPRDFLQLPLSVFFSLVIDLVVAFIGDMKPSNYMIMMGWFLFGCVFRALGVSMQVTADVAMLSGEAVMKVIARKSRMDFSIVKLIGDLAMVIISLILSLTLLGGFVGIREGTIISAIIIAPLTGVFNRRFKNTARSFKLERGAYNLKRNLKSSEENYIITISSQSGSGGHHIARLLGEKLGIKVYDEELTTLIANEAGLEENYVRERLGHLYTNRFWEKFSENYSYIGLHMDNYEELFEAQTKVIDRIGDEGQSIIVGNCSEYLLKNRENVFSIYVHSNLDAKQDFLQREYELSPSKALEYMEKQDRDRALYFKHFTGEEWTSPDRYSMSVDSSILGLEGTAQMLCNVITAVTAKK